MRFVRVGIGLVVAALMVFLSGVWFAALWRLFMLGWRVGMVGA